jgi:hypothetical protein
MYGADQYATHLLLQGDLGLLTRNISLARIFFIPSYATYEVNTCIHRTQNFFACVADVDENYLAPILRAVGDFPAWARHGGSDHVLVVTQDHGLNCGLWARTCAWLRGRGVVWAPTQPRPGSRDVVIPPVTSAAWTPAASYSAVLQQPGGEAAGKLGPFGAPPCAGGGGYDPSTHLLGVFRGNMGKDSDPYYSGGVRQALRAAYGEGGPLARAGLLVGGKSTSFREEMDRALFCVAPPGWAAWTGRMYEYIAAGCPPAVFDHLPPAGTGVLAGGGDTPRPFQSLLDWSAFALSLDARRPLNETHTALLAAQDRACAMRKRLLEAHPFLLWKQSPPPGAAAGAQRDAGGRPAGRPAAPPPAAAPAGATHGEVAAGLPRQRCGMTARVGRR